MNNAIVTTKKQTINERTAPKVINIIEMGSMQVPYSDDAERAVIGAVLINPLSFYDIASLPLCAEDFYLVRHNRIFKAFEEIEKSGDLERLDILVVAEKLRDLGWFEEIGGAVYLSQLSGAAPDSTNGRMYGALVQRLAIRRRMMAAADKIKLLAMDSEQPLEAIVQQANEELFVATEQTIDEAESDVKNIISEYWGKLERIRESGELSQGLPSGFVNLDKLVHLYRGEVAILAGMAGMGKTQILIEIARYVSAILKLRVAFFSREMSQEQLMHRFVSIETGIPIDNLKEPARLSGNDWGRFVAASGNIFENWKLNIVPYKTLTPISLRRHLKKLQREYRIDLVLIDGLWLMNADAPHDKKERKEQIDYITNEVNAIAEETQLRMIMTHQLSRMSVTRGDHHPVLSDLSDSSSIEKNAHIVMALFRESYPSFQIQTLTPDKTEVHVLKNRDSGSTGVAELRWHNGRYQDYK